MENKPKPETITYRGHVLTINDPANQVEPPMPPQAHEVRRQLAQDFDLLGLFRAIRSSPAAWLNAEREFNRLYRVVRARTRVDSAAVVADVMQLGIATVSYVTLRTTAYIEHCLEQTDRESKHATHGNMPEEVASLLVPRLLELHRHLAEIGHLQAATERQRELARAKRLENDLAQQRLGKPPAEKPVQRRQARRFTREELDASAANPVLAIDDPDLAIEEQCRG